MTEVIETVQQVPTWPLGIGLLIIIGAIAYWVNRKRKSGGGGGKSGSSQHRR